MDPRFHRLSITRRSRCLIHVSKSLKTAGALSFKSFCQPLRYSAISLATEGMVRLGYRPDSAHTLAFFVSTRRVGHLPLDWAARGDPEAEAEELPSHCEVDRAFGAGEPEREAVVQLLQP